MVSQSLAATNAIIHRHPHTHTHSHLHSHLHSLSFSLSFYLIHHWSFQFFFTMCEVDVWAPLWSPVCLTYCELLKGSLPPEQNWLLIVCWWMSWMLVFSANRLFLSLWLHFSFFQTFFWLSLFLLHSIFWGETCFKRWFGFKWLKFGHFCFFTLFSDLLCNSAAVDEKKDFLSVKWKSF